MGEPTLAGQVGGDLHEPRPGEAVLHRTETLSGEESGLYQSPKDPVCRQRNDPTQMCPRPNPHHLYSMLQHTSKGIQVVGRAETAKPLTLT